MKTHLTPFAGTTLDSLPKCINFLLHELFHFRISDTWLDPSDENDNLIVADYLTIVTSRTSKI